MKRNKEHLAIKHLDDKLKQLAAVENLVVPSRGWIYTIRTALRMSLSQLSRRLNISTPSTFELEQREQEGTITLNSLRHAGKALNMKLVYGFVPLLNGSLEQMIEKKAMELARTVVLRTSATMKLEDQENSAERIEQAIREQAEIIKNELPKMLWN